MPDYQNLHRESRLTNLAIGWKNLAFVGENLFPTIPVGKESDYYAVFGKEMFNTPDAARAVGGKYNRIAWTLSDTTYTCSEQGLEKPIDDREVSEADPIVRIKQRTAMILRAQLETIREAAIAAKVLSTSNVTNYTDLSSSTYGQWSSSSSDPFGAVKQLAVKSVRDNTGVLPNTMVINHDIFLSLSEHPAVIAKLGANERGVISGDMRSAVLESLFGIERVYIAGGMYDSANQGQSASLAQIWTDTALICYVNYASPSREMPSFGYGFQSKNYEVVTYRDESISSDVLRVTNIRDDKITNATSGYLLTDVLA